MQFSRIASTICAAGLLALPVTANAAVTHFDFTGTITSSQDFTHIGDAFTGKFSYDPDVLPTFAYGAQEIYYNILDISFDSPFGSASAVGNGGISVVHANHRTEIEMGAMTTGDFYLANIIAYLPVSAIGSPLPANFAGQTLYLGAEGRNSLGVIQAFSGIMTASVSAVPETATWAMLLVGFGLTGAAMRRRRPAITTRIAYA